MDKQTRHTHSDGLYANHASPLFTTALAFLSNWPPIPSLEGFSFSRLIIYAKEFVKLVDAMHCFHHSPAFYASKLNISSNYLEKVCKQIFGITPSHCIQIKLVTEACRLLIEWTMDIKEIGYGLGFEDPAYFSRVFKKHTGLSPIAYRRLSVHSSQ